ncbi:SulP family inorganic anion transporter [Corynebacterium ammoniagenes]|uniref:Sodium-independent anion transporter n=2 Tax=Corynebacterium ammoniagenes TaxID=1697 RepID=A0AAV5G8Y5_CORAM|nr:SulP family inorganic anion transporter [Corynebacterium ammoniagenes]APT83019.1 sulfate transporter [Corynebacterium ammoniagenes DSM 20306]AQS74834.1 sodium-independent anion transporter [Corynebacterium ammoniagenes]EFG81947.1 sulfate permease [Corynebacterium ammoniagenes DSM 20306]GJN42715.1 sodium-independent anion transporter [Corynebacterium ammoniagenes]
MRDYQRGWLKGDVIAGITVAAYLVPQVMAFASIVGLPAVVGLWAVLAPMAVYFFLGTSRKMSIGPESTTVLMSAAGISALVGAAGGPEQIAEVAAIMSIAVGLVCLVGYIARLGFLTRLLSRPVLVGYLIGIAVLMIISQLSEMTKIDTEGEQAWQELVSFFQQVTEAHIPTLLMAVVVLVLLYVAHWVAPKFPAPLLVLLLAAGAVAVFHLDRFGLVVIGEVPRGLPAPRLPDLSDLDIWALLPYAVGIAIVGFSDNILTARAFASSKDDPIDANQELLALGTANFANGFFQGFPVSTSGSRTVLGNTVGAKTQVHSLVVIAIVIMVLLFAGPILESFPEAALGALVTYAATQLIDVAELKRIARFRTSELFITAVTALSVTIFGVLVGIGVAIALSILDLIRRITSPYADVLGYAPGVAGMHSLDDYPDSQPVEGLVVFRYDSPIFFANADDFSARAMQAIDVSPQPIRWFLLNAEANTEMDLTAVDALDDLRAELKNRGIRFAMARVKQNLQRSLAPTGFIEAMGEEYVFATLPTAVRAYAREFQQQCNRIPEGIPDFILDK